MTPQEEFLFKWKHEWRGMLMDSSLVTLTGAERSMYFRKIEQKIDANLRQMWADLQPKAANGPPLKVAK